MSKAIFLLVTFFFTASLPLSRAGALEKYASKAPPKTRIICLKSPKGKVIRIIRPATGRIPARFRRYKVVRCPRARPAGSTTPSPAPTAAATPQKHPPPMVTIPELSLWESRMKEHGAQLCSFLRDPNIPQDDLLRDTYYDAEWVFFQIADYTGDSFWNGCAQNAEIIYRDRYVEPNGGYLPGYWSFTDGLTQDFLRTGDSASMASALRIAHTAVYVSDKEPLEATIGHEYSREVAYAIRAYLNEELLGQPRRSRLRHFVDQALGHIDQWSGSKTASFVRPFMVGLTCQALIDWHKVSNDPRILPAIKQVLDYIWEKTWATDQAAFLYTDRSLGETDDLKPSQDLNLLIAPAFAWVYHQTGDDTYREKADQIFIGGVTNAWIFGGKQFNQNYCWSFEYVRLRTLPPLN